MPDTRFFAPSPARAIAATPRARPLRLLLLFEKEWDSGGFAPLVAAGEVELIPEGFDLFRFPSNARVLSFDAWRFVERLCAKYRGRIDAVASNNEQFGALLAAVIAQRLGLPGNDPAAVARAHHKLAARRVQHAVAPEATIASCALPLALGDARVRRPHELAQAVAQAGASFPLFVKPIKATFSVLARRVDDAEALARHLSFGRFERLVIGRLVAPYAQVASRLIDMPCDPARMLLEEPMNGHQVNVDGYAVHGDVRILGIIDEHMYPGESAGARHFLRFAYPSCVAGPVARRVRALTCRILGALGFRHGFFNCEFFVGADGDVRFIEVNPRLGTQMVSLYRDVDGLDVYRMLVALSAGRDPAEVPRLPVRAAAAGSFVWRCFDGSTGPKAASGAAEWLAREYPDARLMTFYKRNRSLAREYKWLGSHRYAVLNMSGESAAALERQVVRVCDRFGWPYQPLARRELAGAAPAPAAAVKAPRFETRQTRRTAPA